MNTHTPTLCCQQLGLLPLSGMLSCTLTVCSDFPASVMFPLLPSCPGLPPLRSQDNYFPVVWFCRTGPQDCGCMLDRLNSLRFCFHFSWFSSIQPSFSRKSWLIWVSNSTSDNPGKYIHFKYFQTCFPFKKYPSFCSVFFFCQPLERGRVSLHWLLFMTVCDIFLK